MNIRSIIAFLKGTSFTHLNTPLGRWNHRHNYQKTTLKIKYATEDNCAFNHTLSHSHTHFYHDDDYKYIYMMGYESVHK